MIVPTRVTRVRLIESL